MTGTDRYTKVVLTVIAISLATIAIRGQSVGPATAQPFGADCGRTEYRPCHITFANPVAKIMPRAGDVRVEITNWPMR
jgi:hypothetical protein